LKRHGACVSPAFLRDFAALCAIALGLCTGVVRADADEPTVTPYRPTISNPADLPVPGWLEGEFGGQHTAGDDGSRNDSVPWLLKYAFDENHGVLIGGDAYVHDAPVGMPSHSGFGDMLLEWKQRFPVSDKTAFGVEAGALLPTAAGDLGIGIGKPAWTVNAIYSSDFGALHLDVNAGGTHYTTKSSDLARWQSAWAAAGSWSLTEAFGAALELSGTHQRGVASASQILGAINYNRSTHLVLDAGLAYGLTHAAHDVSIFAGATVYLGRLR
jgi:hypothetical protein